MVYIIVLNYNGANDTIACLKSILELNYARFKVLVVDNASTDDSEIKIRKYLYFIQDKRFLFIETEKNTGYAGGNNIGIRIALENQEMAYVWVLNNDTIVDKDALIELVNKMEFDKRIGMCGSKQIYEWDRNRLQGYGGKYNKFLGKSSSMKDINRINEIDFVSGASMLLSRELLEKVGLFCEDYFLYFEELDLRERAKNKFTIGCAVKSIVYHKEGASIGSSFQGKKRSYLSDYYLIRNRILFTKKYHPGCLITVYIGLLYTIINRGRRKQFDRISMILKLMCGIKCDNLEK
jgi:GT2 family glycosyltransferase